MARSSDRGGPSAAERGRREPQEKRKVSALWVLANYVGMVLVLLALVAYFSLRSRFFFTPRTFSTIANQIPGLTVMAVGMTYVLMIAGIDLSVGSVLALSGILVSLAMVDWGWSLLPAILLGLACGLACGVLNGLIVVTWSIPSFIVTLGMLEMARGASYLFSGSRTKYIGAQVAGLSAPLVGGVSLSFLIALAVVVAAQLILSYSVFGRFMVGVGTNETTMRLSGINTRPTKVAVFSISGLMAGVGALFHISRLQAADPNAGSGLELQVIAAVVIGGTSLMGGRGSVINTFVGVLIISVLTSGLAQIGASEPTKRLISGLVIVVAVIIDMYRNRLQASRSSAT